MKERHIAVQKLGIGVGTKDVVGKFVGMLEIDALIYLFIDGTPPLCHAMKDEGKGKKTQNRHCRDSVPYGIVISCVILNNYEFNFVRKRNGATLLRNAMLRKL